MRCIIGKSVFDTLVVTLPKAQIFLLLKNYSFREMRTDIFNGVVLRTIVNDDGHNRHRRQTQTTQAAVNPLHGIVRHPRFF